MSPSGPKNQGRADAAGKPRIAETVVVEGKDDQSAVLAALDANVLWTHGYGINSNTLKLIGAAAERTGIVIFTDPDHAGRQIRERLTKLWPDAKQAFLTQAQAEKAGDIGIENAKPEDILRALTAAGCRIEWPEGTGPEKGCRTGGAGEVRRIYGAGNGRRAEGAGEGCGTEGASEDRRTDGAGEGCGTEGASEDRRTDGAGEVRRIYGAGNGRRAEGAGEVRRIYGAGNGRRAAGAGDGRTSENPAKMTPVTMDDLVALGLAGGQQSAEKRALAGARLGIGSANSKAFLRRLSFMGIGLEELAEACR